jgi:hypothetical protein
MGTLVAQTVSDAEIGWGGRQRRIYAGGKPKRTRPDRNIQQYWHNPYSLRFNK